MHLKKYNNVKNQNNITKFLLSVQIENFIDLYQKKIENFIKSFITSPYFGSESKYSLDLKKY